MIPQFQALSPRLFPLRPGFFHAAGHAAQALHGQSPRQGRQICPRARRCFTKNGLEIWAFEARLRRKAPFSVIHTLFLASGGPYSGHTPNLIPQLPAWQGFIFAAFRARAESGQRDFYAAFFRFCPGQFFHKAPRAVLADLAQGEMSPCVPPLFHTKEDGVSFLVFDQGAPNLT